MYSYIQLLIDSKKLASNDFIQGFIQNRRFLNNHIIFQSQKKLYGKMMLNTKVNAVFQKERFQNKLEECSNGFAYQILFLEILIDNQESNRKPTVQEISKLMQLYMLAVQALQSIGDNRYLYFKRKIHTLMLKKQVFQQVHQTKPSIIDQQILLNCHKADLQLRKNQHEVQVFLNKADNVKVQQIIKKADQQVKTFDKNIRKNIMTQQLTLQQRIKNRKLKSQSGSVNKVRLESHNNQFKQKQPIKQPKKDVRMEYFDDYDQTEKKLNLQKKNINLVKASVQKTLKKVPFKEYML